jgi:hypothetical protein
MNIDLKYIENPLTTIELPPALFWKKSTYKLLGIISVVAPVTRIFFTVSIPGPVNETDAAALKLVKLRLDTKATVATTDGTAKKSIGCPFKSKEQAPLILNEIVGHATTPEM